MSKFPESSIYAKKSYEVAQVFYCLSIDLNEYSLVCTYFNGINAFDYLYVSR